MGSRTKTIEEIKSRCVFESAPPDPLARPVSGLCWTWTGAKARAGYGATRHDGKFASVHRLTMELSGIDPGPGHVDHLGRSHRVCRDCRRAQKARRLGRAN